MCRRSSIEEVFDRLAECLEFEIDEGVRQVEFVADPLPALLAQGGGPRLDRPAVEKGMRAIAAAAASCAKCGLCRGRTQSVPGQGRLDPEALFVGEGPGAEEDAQGLAFVGAAGQLLTKMIRAMGFQREDVFIANVVKCRPPGNRQPLPEEMEACLPYLHEQIALLKPKVIVALGAIALKGLLGLTGITRMRGKWHEYHGIPVMPTYHPSYLLRAPSGKRDVWADLQDVLRRLGRPIPPVKKR
ncbi:MAG: uracil-DNA glycosylase [Verrucomicrobiota bacterium]|nr:uracil-DNA glycosylase [Verrucomicrobiota bacterium]